MRDSRLSIRRGASPLLEEFRAFTDEDDIPENATASPFTVLLCGLWFLLSFIVVILLEAFSAFPASLLRVTVFCLAGLQNFVLLLGFSAFVNDPIVSLGNGLSVEVSYIRPSLLGYGFLILVTSSVQTGSLTPSIWAWCLAVLDSVLLSFEIDYFNRNF